MELNYVMDCLNQIIMILGLLNLVGLAAWGVFIIFVAAPYAVLRGKGPQLVAERRVKPRPPKKGPEYTAWWEQNMQKQEVEDD